MNQPTLTNDVVLQKVCGQIADRLAAKKGESGGEIWWDIFWKNRKNWESVRLNLRLLRMPEMLFWKKYKKRMKECFLFI